MSVSISQSCIFRVVEVIKSLQDPLQMGSNLSGINDNVRERGLYNAADSIVNLLVLSLDTQRH